MSGVRRHGSKFIWFNASAYVKAVGEALKEEMYKLRQDLRAEILGQLKEIPFKRNNVVRLADGTLTDDMERSAALLDSVFWDPVKHEVGKALSTAVFAMRDHFEQSHIGWYYEYGTGTKQDEEAPVAGYYGDPVNKYRAPAVGSPIVTRSKFVNGGLWRDLGGNLRLSGAPRAGVTSEQFLKYIDQETESYYWFAEGVNLIRRKFKGRILAAIKSVPIDDARFWQIKKTFTIGKD